MRSELSFDAVLTAYGLTEAVVVTMCRPDDDPQTVATTSGRATAGFEIKIANGNQGDPGDPGDLGVPTGTVPTGEILLRGPNVILGYLHAPAPPAAPINALDCLHTDY